MNNLTTKELKAIARDAGVKGWWDMKKADLIAEIEKTKMTVIIPDDKEVEPDVDTLAEPEKVDQGAPKKNQKRMIEYNGKTQTLTAWAKELGIRHQTLYNRIVMKGWDVEKAFTKEVKVHAEESQNA